jgi:hypothetical protein
MEYFGERAGFSSAKQMKSGVSVSAETVGYWRRDSHSVSGVSRTAETAGAWPATTAKNERCKYSGRRSESDLLELVAAALVTPASVRSANRHELAVIGGCCRIQIAALDTPKHPFLVLIPVWHTTHFGQEMDENCGENGK